MNSKRNYDELQSRMPPGYILWGNFGDGLWRVAPAGMPQSNCIKPCADPEMAMRRAWGHFNGTRGDD